jgi:hypothetical protein
MSDDPAVGQQLAVINIKLDLLITQRDDHEARLRVLESKSESPDDRQRRETAIETRMSAVERFQWKQIGAAVGLASLASAGLVKFAG